MLPNFSCERTSPASRRLALVFRPHLQCALPAASGNRSTSDERARRKPRLVHHLLPPQLSTPPPQLSPALRAREGEWLLPLLAREEPAPGSNGGWDGGPRSWVITQSSTAAAATRSGGDPAKFCHAPETPRNPSTCTANRATAARSSYTTTTRCVACVGRAETSASVCRRR